MALCSLPITARVLPWVLVASRAAQSLNKEVVGSQKVPINNLEVAPWENSLVSPHQSSDADLVALTLLGDCPSIDELTPSEVDKAPNSDKSLLLNDVSCL